MLRKRQACSLAAALVAILECVMSQHLIAHVVACAILNRVVEIIVAVACIVAFGWLWSAALTVLVTGSRLYASRLTEASWRGLARGDGPC